MRITYCRTGGSPEPPPPVPLGGSTLTAILERPDGTAIEEVYDFSGLRPGDEIVGVEPENLPFSPLVSARMSEEGKLHLQLLLWYEGELDWERAIAEAWPDGVPEEVEHG